MSTFDTTLLGFILTVVLIELTPGPNMTYLAILSASRGSRAGLAAVAGVAVGLATVGLLAAVGVAALVSQSRALWQVLRWAGVLYLLWLAWEGWRGAEGNDEHEDAPSAATSELFMRGVVTNLLNPKAYLFYIAVLPRFTAAIEGSAFGRTVTLTLIYVAIATVIHAGIVLAAGQVQRLFATEQAIVVLRKSLSALLALVALWLAWETRGQW